MRLPKPGKPPGKPLRAMKSTSDTIRVADFMTAETRQATGVEALSPAQRAALDEWLRAYTVEILDYAGRWAKQAL